MGLDMFLNRMPRYRGATAEDVSAVENYLDYIAEREKGSEYAKGTFEEWCGIKEVPSQKYVDFYSQFYEKKYSSWDTEKQYGYARIMEQVGYWRKANQIHNWFVENIQDGIDDCRYHHEVTEDDLERLLDICKTVYESCTLGKVVIDSSVAEELLPTTSGFFFGSTDYNEWYVKDIADTIEIIQNVLDTTDFDKQMVYYVSSW